MDLTQITISLGPFWALLGVVMTVLAVVYIAGHLIKTADRS